MKISKRLTKFGASILVVFLCFLMTAERVSAATSVNLETADSFAILAGSGITNTGTTVVTGDAGTYPTTTESGFGTVTINGTNHAGDATTQGAKNDLVTAYNNAGQTSTGIIAADLGGQTLTPGVYKDNGAPDSLSITGTLTLDAQGDPNAVFIFQSGSYLTTAPGASVALINGAQACNVFWQIGSSATLDTTTSFKGNILAFSSVTLNTGATVIGRVLTSGGAVTLDSNTITKATCLATPTPTPTATPTPTPTLAPTPTPTPTFTVTGPTQTLSPAGASSSYCPGLDPQIVAPVIIESRRIDADSIYVSWGPYSGTNTFNVEYGTANGNWLYSTDVTGFSTIINDLPPNLPVWVRVAARNNCTVGSYGESVLTGGPSLPTTGLAPRRNTIASLWYAAFVILAVTPITLVKIRQRKNKDVTVL